jgi:hypothetical protein
MPDQKMLEQVRDMVNKMDMKAFTLLTLAGDVYPQRHHLVVVRQQRRRRHLGVDY